MQLVWSLYPGQRNVSLASSKHFFVEEDVKSTLDLNGGALQAVDRHSVGWEERELVTHAMSFAAILDWKRVSSTNNNLRAFPGVFGCESDRYDGGMIRVEMKQYRDGLSFKKWKPFSRNSLQKKLLV